MTHDDFLRHYLPAPTAADAAAGAASPAVAAAGAPAKLLTLGPALPTRGLPCPLCGHPVAPAQRPDSRCAACHSPLALPPGVGVGAAAWPGRRSAVRRDQSHVAMVHLGWPSAAEPVRWRDLSLGGLSFYIGRALAPGQRLRLIDSALEGVAEVVGCRRQGRLFAVHARLLSALPLQSTGVFISAEA
jgi:hypothetical protein